MSTQLYILDNVTIDLSHKIFEVKVKPNKDKIAFDKAVLEAKIIKANQLLGEGKIFAKPMG